MRPLFFSMPGRRARLALGCMAALLTASCSDDTPHFKSQVPGPSYFFQSGKLEDGKRYNEAVSKLSTIVYAQAGTRLANLAYLKLGDIQFEKGDWEEAEYNYRSFLQRSPDSHLAAYAMYKLFVVTYKNTLTGMFIKSPEYERNIAPARQLVTEYQRFVLLYPNSIYIQKARPYYEEALANLADYEKLVGDFYLDRKEYPSAIGRYNYLLLHYPGYRDSRPVLENLTRAYLHNRQPGKAKETLGVLQAAFGPQAATELAQDLDISYP
ncbi:MAG: outer membrane protein assembly factor BamD [Deltaproteobacteria bacterium]|nr:outer membrane protein assembly factor BamD [Deltaproteobacteria bacterium]